jgi:hypothetical protein
VGWDSQDPRVGTFRSYLDTDKDASSGSPEIEALKVTPKDLGVAAWTCSLGSALEYYDFALYSLASALIFGPMFFPTKSQGLVKSPVLPPALSVSPCGRWAASSLAHWVIDSAESSSW